MKPKQLLVVSHHGVLFIWTVRTESGWLFHAHGKCHSSVVQGGGKNGKKVVSFDGLGVGVGGVERL
jgi:hypothetical protein